MVVPFFRHAAEGSRPTGDRMGRYWLGCCGWAYDDWVGPFYPPGTPPGEFLARYARVFRTVEVDSSFYRAPPPSSVRRWLAQVPDGFRFALKVPRTVTHDRPYVPLDASLTPFLGAIAPLVPSHLAAIVLQFPPSFRAPRDAGRLEELLAAIPPALPLAVELRHGSWWSPATHDLLAGRRAALVWSVTPDAEPPPWHTGGFVYARFVGDRALERFDRIQRRDDGAIARMHQRFDDEGRSAETIFAYSNNHFLGFGPATVVELARTLAEPVPDLARAARAPGQRSLGDVDG